MSQPTTPPRLLVVFGATGNQGLSVINHVLSTPSLSRTYTLRAITRDPTSARALALAARGITLHPADASTPSTLPAALRSAHAVFAMTRSAYTPTAHADEFSQGRAIADAAVAAGVKLLIWSTAAHAGHLSGGRFPVPAYDAKAEVEGYIRTLSISSAFVAPGSFLQNLSGLMGARPAGDGSFVMAGLQAADTRCPWVDVETDVGVFVGAILAAPAQFAGKTLAAASGVWSFAEVVAAMARVSGQVVRYERVSEEVYCGWCPPEAADAVVRMFRFIEECGYYGEGTEELVRWSVEQVGGGERLVGLEEYLRGNLTLESGMVID